MANSRFVIKSTPLNAATAVGGAQWTRYGNYNVEYGSVAAGAYTKGDFFYFGTIPSKKIIRATFATKDTTPIVTVLYPGFNLATIATLTQTSGSSAIGFTYVIEYDSLFSGTPGVVLTLQVS